MFDHFNEMSPFAWLNFVISFGSIVLVMITVRHYLFFRKSQQSGFASRIRDVFLADFVSALSVLSFNFVVFITGSINAFVEMQMVPYALKIFQGLAVFINVWASWRLHAHYRKMH